MRASARPGLQCESQVLVRAGRWQRLPGGAGSGSNQEGSGVQDDWATEGAEPGVLGGEGGGPSMVDTECLQRDELPRPQKRGNKSLELEEEPP